MRGFAASVRRDARALCVALIAVALAELLVRRLTADGAQLPISVLMVPVLCLALVAGGPATAVAGAAAVAFGLLEYVRGSYSTSDLTLRLVTLIVGCGVAAALAGLRTRRERTMRVQAATLEAARSRQGSEEILRSMLPRLPELSAAPEPVGAAAAACRLAQDLFAADTVSYWHGDGDDEVVLWAREPDNGDLPVGIRLPRALISGDRSAVDLSRTVWVRRGGGDAERDETMHRVDAAVGSSTPVLLSGETIGYLTMAWAQDRDQPDRFWFDVLDRFADQVALAKTVIRRRTEQQKAQALARRFQAGLLPHLPDVAGLGVQSFYRPGLSQMLLGGDFLDARLDDRGRLCFILGDVAGHGPEQAALGSTLRGGWRAVCSIPELGVEDWARALDVIVRENSRPDGALFATAIMGHLDPATQTLTYVSAGHPPPLLLAASVTAGPTGDGVLGVGADPKFHARVVDLLPVKAVLLVTDGMFEVRRDAGEGGRLDFDGFLDFLHARGLDRLEHPEYLRELADEMERHHGSALPDDAAALLLLVDGPGLLGGPGGAGTST